MTRFRAGIDIGGTFTDVVFIGSDGTLLVKKVASSPEDYSLAVLQGLTEGIAELGTTAASISEVSHGFTVATNAILERKGGKTALVTTEGFRDVLEISRIRTPRLYDMYYQKPPPLVEGCLRFEVTERVNFRGEVLVPLDISSVEEVAARIADEGVRSVAISLMHSYANPEHESAVARAISKRIPEASLSVSSELLPEMREYERTSTTVINAYVRPVVQRYLTRLSEKTREMGIGVPLTIMQSNGGLAPASLAADKPMYCIESGPAAGVVGAYQLGKRLGLRDIMTFDMGGTTAKASIIEDGQMLRAPEYEVGGGMTAGHRLLKGSGYVLRVPAIDLAEVSAGGGSIAWVDRGGALQAGPSSAGAVPGPACYGAGGEEPTVTDANVALGYLNPEHLLGGDFSIEADKARAALSDRVAGPLGLSDMEAAYGVHLLVNSNMGRALRAVSTERGRDSRRFVLMAFGGGGPIHAAGLAEMLGITRVVVPPSPGVFSAFGLLFADVEHHFVRTHFKAFAEMDLDQANGILTGLLDSGERLLSEEGFDEAHRQMVTQVDMKYVGQTSELTVNMGRTRFSEAAIEDLAAAFEIEHDKTYGYSVDDPLQLVNIRVLARGISEEPRVPENLTVRSGVAVESERQVYFAGRHGWLNTPVIGQAQLDGAHSRGPLVVEEYDSTTVVPPGWQASVDPLGNITLEKKN